MLFARWLGSNINVDAELLYCWDCQDDQLAWVNREMSRNFTDCPENVTKLTKITPVCNVIWTWNSIELDSLLPKPRTMCFRRCLSACLFVGNFVQKILNGFVWDFLGRSAVGQQTNIKFWWRSRSGIRIRIMTLVRRSLAEVCTLPVLLVTLAFSALTLLVGCQASAP